MSKKRRNIGVIGVPIDLGAGRRGVDMGPSAIRIADLEKRLEELGHKVEDYGDLDVMIPETQKVGTGKMRYKKPILSACKDLMKGVDKCLTEGRMPLVLGGDHSIALGSISGAARARGKIGVIWFDAHGDFNTSETSPSGNIHGMILAALCGYGDPRLVHAAGAGPQLDASRVVIVGARDIDTGEREVLRQAGAHVRTMSDIDRLGIGAVTHEAIALATSGTEYLHVSFDMDVVDPTEAPGVGTPVPGGITYREAHLAMELVAESGKLGSLDLVEVNPILDRESRTAHLATELALSALGKRIF